jgi:hypothetical protein
MKSIRLELVALRSYWTNMKRTGVGLLPPLLAAAMVYPIGCGADEIDCSGHDERLLHDCGCAHNSGGSAAYSCDSNSFGGASCCAMPGWPDNNQATCGCQSCQDDYFTSDGQLFQGPCSSRPCDTGYSPVQSCSAGGGGSSSGACNSGPGTCTNPTSANSCRNGAVCERPCETCDYQCLVSCSNDAECAGFCNSDGTPTKCMMFTTGASYCGAI